MQRKPLFAAPYTLEDKPSFDDIPPHIIAYLEEMLGDKIKSGNVVYGSFSASAGFVLTLSSGKKVFAKGCHPGEMAHGTENLRQEIKAYQSLPVLQDVSPCYIGHVYDGDDDGWMLALWEYAGKNINGLSENNLAGIYDALHRFQSAPVPENTVPYALQKNFINQFFVDEKKWKRICHEADVREKFCGLFYDMLAGDQWLGRNAALLLAAQQRLMTLPMKQGLVHGDLRRDNIICTEDRVFIVDWPNACIGPLLFDLVFLFTHLESLGYGMFENFMADYQSVSGIGFTAEEQAVMLAGVTGYFADQAYRVVPPRLPRLRWMQKSLMLAGLHALARLGAIETPPKLKDQQV